MNTTKNKRNEWIESVRVLATLLIIIYHVPSAFPNADKGSMPEFILSFLSQPGASLAVFFILAGYFTKKQMPIRKWLSRLLALVIPFIIWNSLFAFGLNDEKTISRIYGIGSGGFLCADYPLWFVLAITYMTLLWPIWRKAPELCLCVCIFFAFWGNNWHSDYQKYLPLPNPTIFGLFLSGVCLSRFSLDSIQKVLVYAFPLLLALQIVNLYYLPFSLTLSNINAAALILSFMALCTKACPFIIRHLAKFSPAVFMCYASHAGILIVLGNLYRLCGQPFNGMLNGMHLLIPIMILMANVVAFKWAQKYSPWILPFIAHYGHLPRFFNLNNKKKSNSSEA